MKYLSHVKEKAPPRNDTFHMTKFRILVMTLLLALSGFTDCFAQSSDLADLGDIGDVDFAALESAMMTGNIPDDVVHPCDAFSISQLTELFGEEAKAATVKRGLVQSNATCDYKWPNPNDPTADKESFQLAFMEAMMGGADSSAKMAKIISLAKQSEFELSINFNHGGDFGNEADAIDGIDRMVAQLTKGVGDESFSYRATFEPSENIGAKAVWSEKLRQVTAVSGTYLYHVRLQRKADAASDREDAESVARVVAEKLRH